MHNNKLEGSVLGSISRARRLTQIFIFDNKFEGEIQAEICEMHELIAIDVSKNRFFGNIPTCITGLKKLQKLRMQENQFSGEILDSVGSRSGRVYKVKLKPGITVAVKRLWTSTALNPESEEVFRSKIETLGRIRHGNILKLLFGCSGESFRILVYEYMEKPIPEFLVLNLPQPS